MPAAVRSRADACPGVFAPHDAADGALARIRLPGGVIDATALRVLAGCAEELGDGRVHLTSRGNLQLRGLSRSPALAARLTDAGLLPLFPQAWLVDGQLRRPHNAATAGRSAGSPNGV